MDKKYYGRERRKDMYCVILGDMLNSREMTPQERDAAGVLARQTFERINEEYRNYLLSGFGFASGDSFEAVLLAQYKSPIIIQKIIKDLYPVSRFRISVGLGELYTFGDTNSVNTMDGPAFHIAADKMAELKKNKSRHWLQLAIQTAREAQPLVQATLSLLFALTSRWTDKQRQVAWDIERLGGDLNKLADEMNVTVNAIRKHLKVSDYESYRNAWLALEEYLADMDKNLITPSNDEPGYTVFLNAACRSLDNSKLETAEKLSRKALAVAETTFGVNDPQLAPILNKLGEVLLRLEQCKEAEFVLSRSLLIQEELPPGRNTRLHTLMFMGEAQFGLENYAEAKRILSMGKGIELAIRGGNSANQFNWDGILSQLS